MDLPKLQKAFSDVDASEFPDFYYYDNPLDMGLWLLWIAKEKLNIRKLTSDQIASIILNVKEVAIDAISITKAFNRAGDKVYTHQDNKLVYYEIMRSGKNYLISKIKRDHINIIYFEPNKEYTSKKIFSKNILTNLRGDLRIVDPYCGERTLDVIKDVKKNSNVKFLTRIDNLSKNNKTRFLRELKDFKSENSNVEFRTYSKTDIHDRYIISSDQLILLGHSIKDLGGKESFCIMLKKNANRDIVGAIIQNFDRRWIKSNPL